MLNMMIEDVRLVEFRQTPTSSVHFVPSAEGWVDVYFLNHNPIVINPQPRLKILVGFGLQ